MFFAISPQERDLSNPNAKVGAESNPATGFGDASTAVLIPEPGGAPLVIVATLMALRRRGAQGSLAWRW